MIDGQLNQGQTELLRALAPLRSDGPGPQFVAKYDGAMWMIYAGNPDSGAYRWQETPPFSEADLLALRNARKLWVAAIDYNPTVYLGFLTLPGAPEMTWNRMHPDLVERVQVPFQTQQYDVAAFNALKAVEAALRGKTSAPADLVGRDLVSEALNPKTPKLIVSQVASEQEGAHALFRGAVGLFKNPHSHRFDVPLSPQESAEILHFASLLLRIIDRATLAP